MFTVRQLDRDLAETARRLTWAFRHGDVETAEYLSAELDRLLERRFELTATTEFSSNY